MSRRNNSSALKLEEQAHLFSALGDPTRLSLVAKLNNGHAHSISSLTAGNKISRQAITRHLSVLEDVGLVTKVKEGRESLYELDPKPLAALQQHLDVIASQWDKALQNLKNFVED